MIKKISLTFFGSILLSASVSAQMYQQKMSTFLNLIDNYYVKDVNVDSLVEFGMKQMLKQLDPHSVYMNADEIKKQTNH
jgi:carboxyl-terminal processing protease